MKDVTIRLKDLGFDIQLTLEAKEFLSDKGYDPQFGARPLHRAIQKYVEDPLAEEILRANAKPGDAFIFDLEKGASELRITHQPAAKTADTGATES